MTQNQIVKAFKNGIPLIWNDPDPIEGNDYTITNISEIWKDGALIEYGKSSEAEVYLHEISIKKCQNKK